MVRIELPAAIKRGRKYVAVFVNGSLLCPDHPDDEGDYAITATEIGFHAGIRPDDLVTVTDFRTFRWVFQEDHWHQF